MWGGIMTISQVWLDKCLPFCVN